MKNNVNGSFVLLAFSHFNIINIVSYIYFSFLSSRILHLESGPVASESLLQKPALRVVTSFEAYVSDVIGR